MNVTIFFTYNMSLSEWDKLGIIDREIKLYNHLSEKYNVNFTFVTYGDIEDLSFSYKLKNIDIIPIYNLLQKPKNKYIQFIKSFFIPFKIKNLLKDSDIYKTNQLYGSWVPIILKIIKNKPLIIRTGFDLLSFRIKEKKNIIKLAFYFLLTQAAALASSLYFVTTKNDKKFLLKNFIWFNKSKLQIIPNWITETDYSGPEQRKKNRILSVGRLEEQKNFDNLIKVFKDSNLEIDIVGTGSLEKKLKETAIESNVKVNFLGSINHEKLLEIYKDYRYFVLYSTFEGHPKSLLEAMSRGCICFVNVDTNTIEIIEDKVNGFDINKLQKSLPESIKNLNDQKEKQTYISKNAFKFTIENYSLEFIAEKEKLAYGSIL